MKQVKCLLGGKRVRVDTQGRAQRESHALVVVWITCIGHFFRVSSGQSSCFAWLWVRIWFILGSSPVRVGISQPRWILARRPMGRLTSPAMGWCPPPFLTPEEPFCACVVGKVSLTSRMRNMWSLYLLSGQNSAPLCPCHYCYLKVSTGGKVQLFTLFLLSFLSGSVNRRLAVNV